VCRDGLRSSPRISAKQRKLPGLLRSPSRHKAAPTRHFILSDGKSPFRKFLSLCRQKLSPHCKFIRNVVRIDPFPYNPVE